MPDTVVPVRLLPGQVVEAAAVMARAAVDDPIFVHVLPDATERAAGVPLLMQLFVRMALAYGEVWATPAPIRGVACWMAPSHPEITQDAREAAGERKVSDAFGAEAFARFQAFRADMGETFGSYLPEPHWHLMWLCVEPGHHGQGIGGTLVRQLTAHADTEPVACDLFTFVPRTVPLYEHLGFRAVLDTTLSRTGLRVQAMVRPSLSQR
jgi:GNAT superfamily N-acetyltransferase